MLKLFDPDASKSAAEKKNVKVAVTSFFSDKPLVIDDKIPAGDINDYVTPTFMLPMPVGWCNAMAWTNAIV